MVPPYTPEGPQIIVFRGMFGGVRQSIPGVFARQFPYRSLPECSARPQYPIEHSSKIRYEFDTATRKIGKLGVKSIPVPRVLVPSTARPKYRGYGYLFGTASMPVADTSGS